MPTFVLTHHARPPLTMAGGTEFRFVTGGIHEALRQAREALGYECAEQVVGERATHMFIRKCVD